jgi:hypothetical protein
MHEGGSVDSDEMKGAPPFVGCGGCGSAWLEAHAYRRAQVEPEIKLTLRPRGGLPMRAVAA